MAQRRLRALSGVYLAPSLHTCLTASPAPLAEWEEAWPGRRQKELTGQLFQTLRPSAQFRVGSRGGQKTCFNFGLSRAGRQGDRTGSTWNRRARPRWDSSVSRFSGRLVNIFRASYLFPLGGIGVRCKEKILNDRREQTDGRQ